ncbi:hypothetical protein BGZ83_002975 [Gryganskiella cystojenkinii]|nr:hypothetical protein BGZ83_002975 [Gryganskiella cystojenkinii]
MNPHRVHKPKDEFDETPIKYPSKLPPSSDGKNPHVMIVGAGLAGLFLAILLDKAGIPYEVYERSASVKPLGSVMSLSPNILAAFDQIGLLDEIKSISYPADTVTILFDNMKVISKFEPPTSPEVGYNLINFPRPALYELLLSKVPAERIHYGKKVMSMQQNKEGVMIRCADGTTYHGDVLVGADGAHSGVRQHLYKTLEKENKLPLSDSKDMSKGFMAMVGTTNPLDPEKFPFVNTTTSPFAQVIGRGTSFNWSEFPMPNHQVCWVVVSQVASLEESERIKFRNSEWGPESNPEFIALVRDFKVPGAGTLGTLIDATPSENISRVFLEEKLFETWAHGRTVLIGDAAHKLLPSAGQGAVCALQDAVILANCLYDVESLSRDHIQDALLDFKAQRYEHVKEQFDKSKLNAALLYGQTLSERCIRYMILNFVPYSLKLKAFIKGFAYRPQLNFMPLAPKRGTSEVLPQKPSKRYEREQKQKREAEEGVKDEPVVTETATVAEPAATAV